MKIAPSSLQRNLRSSDGRARRDENPNRISTELSGTSPTSDNDDDDLEVENNNCSNEIDQGRERERGRTFIDFENDSIPSRTVQTFLRDCCRHPKILFHKDFKFFRSYLKEVAEVSVVESSYNDDHDDKTFCVDVDDNWLKELQERVEISEDDDEEDEVVQDYYWASIIPIRRRSDLGLIIFKWESHPLSISLLELYVQYCKSTPKMELNSVVDNRTHTCASYIDRFLRSFKCDRNADVEERLKDDIEAKERRRQGNPAQLSPCKLDILLTNAKCKPVSVALRRLANVKVGQRYSANSFTTQGSSDERSSSSDASSDNDESWNYNSKIRRDSGQKRKNSSNKSTLPRSINHLRKNLDKTISRIGTKSHCNFYMCEMCPGKGYRSKNSLYKHIKRCHKLDGEATSSLITCKFCGRNIRHEIYPTHRQFCQQ